jgi:hypothetical protein
MGACSLFAQDTPPQDNGGQGGQGGRRGFGRGGNVDPAQMRQMMMDGIKERLEVTDDNEWKALEPLVQKVMDAQQAVMAERVRGFLMGARGGRGPGGNGGNQDNGQGGQNQQRRFRGGFFGGGDPSPEFDSLQKAVDAKASKAEMKAAMSKFVAARKTKQIELEKAQAELRKLLTLRQEAIATLSGLL